MTSDADRPFIAVTAKVRQDPGSPTLRTIIDNGYLRGTEIAGGTPVVVSPAQGEATSARLLEISEGLVLTGGEDVDPRRYGALEDGANRVSPERDELEVGLAERAIDRGIPILAICRGMQLLNVALGGSLVGDLLGEGRTERDHDQTGNMVSRDVHSVRVEGTRLLRGVFRDDTFRVNSTHHQGLREMADGLVPVAWSEGDDVVEAVEYRGDRTDAWIAGVQWHPERMLDERTGTNRRLFERFGQAVRASTERVERPA